MSNPEDGHSKRETPGLIPNPEVKPFALMAQVSKRSQSIKLSSFLIFSRLFHGKNIKERGRGENKRIFFRHCWQISGRNKKNKKTLHETWDKIEGVKKKILQKMPFPI